MKKLLGCLLCIFMLGQVYGQRAAKFWWFDTGVKAQFGATSLYSQAIADNNTWAYDVTTGYSYGAKFGINKGTSGLTIDVMLAQGEQDFEYVPNQDGSQDLKASWNSIDLYTLYRNNRQLGYVELGPKFSFLNKAELSNIDGTGTQDIAEYFESNVVSAVLGFGAYFIGSDGAFSGIVGLRLEYGLTDAINADGHGAGAPILDAALYKDGVTSTAPIFAGVSFELNWGIGYLGKASCGGRSKFIKF